MLFLKGNIIDKYNMKSVLKWLALDVNCNCEGNWLQRRIELMKKCCSEAALEYFIKFISSLDLENLFSDINRVVADYR